MKNKSNSKNCRFVVKLLCGADVLLRLKKTEPINKVHSTFESVKIALYG